MSTESSQAPALLLTGLREVKSPELVKRYVEAQLAGGQGS